MVGKALGLSVALKMSHHLCVCLPTVPPPGLQDYNIHTGGEMLAMVSADKSFEFFDALQYAQSTTYLVR